MITFCRDGVWTDVDPRCGACQKKLAERLTRPWRIRCIRCSHVNEQKPLRAEKITPPATTENTTTDKTKTTAIDNGKSYARVIRAKTVGVSGAQKT